MSSGGYSQYGGNPYGGSGQGGYGSSNPYGDTGGYGRDEESGYGASSPYGQTSQYGQTGAYNEASARPQVQQPDYSSPQALSTAPGAPQQSTVMSNPDFLDRVDGVKGQIRLLTANIGEIGAIHQRILNNPDNIASSQLENLVAQTQVLNTQIKDQIKFLETDAAKSGANQTKSSQIRTLKSNFKSQLEEYQREEQTYRQRYREQISRQYRVVNPNATEDEVRQAADANWGDEGVFQTALKTNRLGTATSALGNVRARHNDIQQIERTLIELNQLFQDLAEQVILQEEPVKQVEAQTENVQRDTTEGNKQLDKGIVSARRARKLKWICFFIVVLIILIIALVLGLYFGLKKA